MYKVGQKVRFSEQFFREEKSFARKYKITPATIQTIIKEDKYLARIDGYGSSKEEGSFYFHHVTLYKKPTVIL